MTPRDDIDIPRAATKAASKVTAKAATPWVLTDIEQALRASWAADTCSPDDVERAPWTGENPAWGQCDITALVVHDIFGGDLLFAEVRLGAEQHGYHWWNRLPGGVEIDLTHDQFRRGQQVGEPRAVRRPPGRLPRRAEEYELLRSRVAERLGPLPLSQPAYGTDTDRAREPERGSDAEAVRGAFEIVGRRLSYLDFGGPGQPLLALHGHFGQARTFTRLARDLAPKWRVIALDQRGHGYSDRPADFSREGYIEDAAGFLGHLGLRDVVVLGHSLGGLNAYQLAARRPDLVRALIIEDMGTEIAGDLSFCLSWPHRAPTRAALLEGLGDAGPYLTDGLSEYADGWGLTVHPEDMVMSNEQHKGDHWADWLARDCPALLVHGTRSDILAADHAKAMASRRPHTRLVQLPTGHMVHESAPAGFAAVVGAFLETI
ncbi:alpha/beta hydrolase [Streptomyces sp. NPDC091212]|uniref:alpha/beta fold hydrolase n=1 Tax=Streptomyces sp. NPDC091212 TaxID=3155191 RepID=UPI00342D206C